MFCHKLVQEIITIHLSGQLSLNAGRGPARLSQNNDPLRLKCRHFIRKKLLGNVVGVFNLTKWEYDMKLCASVELVTSHYVLSHDFRFITQ